MPFMFDPPHLITTPSISFVTIYIFYCNGQTVIPVWSDGGKWLTLAKQSNTVRQANKQQGVQRVLNLTSLVTIMPGNTQCLVTIMRSENTNALLTVDHSLYSLQMVKNEGPSLDFLRTFPKVWLYNCQIQFQLQFQLSPTESCIIITVNVI